MEHNIQQQEAILKVKKRVQELKEFYNHLMVYIFVNLLLLAAAIFFIEDLMFFFILSAFGWGIGVIAQAMKTFNWNPLYNKDWEERKIQEILEKEK